jgi:hypothetical protein
MPLGYCNDSPTHHHHDRGKCAADVVRGPCLRSTCHHLVAQYRYRNANERMLRSFNDVGQCADPERVPRNAAFRLLARHKSELTDADCKYAAGLLAALRNYSNVHAHLELAMTKSLSAAAAIVLALSVSACGHDKDEDDTRTSTTPPSAAERSAADQTPSTAPTDQGTTGGTSGSGEATASSSTSGSDSSNTPASAAASTTGATPRASGTPSGSQ